ncbi:MAG: FHA domain-containing protein [Rubrivivax sp.]|nr:FHA domain-containing protein [Rubrivivax sp.]
MNGPQQAGEPPPGGAAEGPVAPAAPEAALQEPVDPAAPDAIAEVAMQGPLALAELLDRDGRVRLAVPVAAWPLRIGRAIDNEVVIDDPHVAPHHAVVEQAADGAAQLRVLPGRNGVRCGRRQLPAGSAAVPLSALAPPPAAGPASGSSTTAGPIELTLGHTRLRLRLAGEALEPERALHDAGFGHLRTLGLALLLWLWILAEQAITLDPGSKAADWISPLLAVPAALAGWCLVWGLASKLFQHRFEFWTHLAVVVPGLLGLELATFVLQWASALSGWPGFARLVTGVNSAIALFTLWGHARLVLPHHRRALGWAAGAAYVAGAAILLGLNQQRSERWFAELYSHVLPPPALMWHTPAPREAFVERAEQLKPALDKSTAEAAAEQKDRGDDEED